MADQHASLARLIVVMQNRLLQGSVVTTLMAAMLQAGPSMAAVYSAWCQFNDQPVMGCVVNAKPVPFGWIIQWQDGVVESYAHVGDGSSLRDERGGIWRRLGDDEQELLLHANGNRIRIQFVP